MKHNGCGTWCIPHVFFHQDHFEILQWYVQDITMVLPRYYHVFTLVIPRFSHGITKVLPRYDWYLVDRSEKDWLGYLPKSGEHLFPPIRECVFVLKIQLFNFRMKITFLPCVRTIIMIINVLPLENIRLAMHTFEIL